MLVLVIVLVIDPVIRGQRLEARYVINIVICVILLLQLRRSVRASVLADYDYDYDYDYEHEHEHESMAPLRGLPQATGYAGGL